MVRITKIYWYFVSITIPLLIKIQLPPGETYARNYDQELCLGLRKQTNECLSFLGVDVPLHFCFSENLEQNSWSRTIYFAFLSNCFPFPYLLKWYQFTVVESHPQCIGFQIHLHANDSHWVFPFPLCPTLTVYGNLRLLASFIMECTESVFLFPWFDPLKALVFHESRYCYTDLIFSYFCILLLAD